MNAERGTILYIEDTPENRMLVRRILMSEGYGVLEAPNAKTALEILTQTNPSLILMDINMPDMDGYALTSHIRTMPQYNHIPIIAVTANVMKGDKERSLAAGCDGFIPKPIDIDLLTTQIERFLEKKR